MKNKIKLIKIYENYVIYRNCRFPFIHLAKAVPISNDEAVCYCVFASCDCFKINCNTKNRNDKREVKFKKVF